MAFEQPVWGLLSDRYLRLEVTGWERLPDEPSLLVGVHSGCALTMDAWTFVAAWYRRFGEQRILHGTAHDVLMATPGLGHYFRANGVLPASREAVTRALASGHDVLCGPAVSRTRCETGANATGWCLPDAKGLSGRRFGLGCHLELVYREVEAALQAGMDRLAARRRLPILRIGDLVPRTTNLSHI